MFVSRETEGNLSEDGSSERIFHRGSAPGPCGLSRLGGYIQSMRGKFVCRRADGNAAGLRLGPWCLTVGPPRPRIFANGGSTPEPRVTFVRTKVTKKRWGDPRPPLFIQSVCIEADTSQPPNFHTLRASDLRLVFCPTSPDGLLKGEANLIFCVGPPAPIGPCTGFRHQKIEMSLIPRAVRRSAQRTAPITRGHRPCGDSVATGFLPCRRPIEQKRGPGCPRRRFGYFAAEGKVTRAGARNTPKQPEGLIKGDSEGLSSDKIPSPPGSGSKSFPPGGNHFSPIAPLPGQIGPWMQKPPGFSVGICPLFFYRLLKCSRIVLY